MIIRGVKFADDFEEVDMKVDACFVVKVRFFE